MGNGFPSTQKPAATFSDNSQGYDNFKGLALYCRGPVEELLGIQLRIAMDFISDKSFNMVVQKCQQGDNYCFNYRLKQLIAKNSSTGPRKHISY